VTSSPDALVPGEGDPMAYGDKENGVLVNPVRQVVGGQKHVRGKRGSIRFPDKDDDLRLIRWFLRTDEPAKVSHSVVLFFVIPGLVSLGETLPESNGNMFVGGGSWFPLSGCLVRRARQRCLPSNGDTHIQRIAVGRFRVLCALLTCYARVATN
jgi:hypothetical protein